MLITQFFLHSVWVAPLYALLGAVLSIFWSPALIRQSGPRPAAYINLLLTLFAFVHSSLALFASWGYPPEHLSISWLEVAGLNFSLDVELSSLSIAAVVVVTGINLLAQLYAIGYLEMDWGLARFYSMLGLFEAGMCGLALCDSLFFSYVILEVLTLGTYLLIGFWFNQPLVVTGARDAFLTKRVGDLILLMGVVALLPLAGTWNYDGLADWAATAQISPTTATLLSLALIAGPLGKCAQFPLHLWLDEAMEGPLPASILRNSVVVATGAWVLIKLQPVLALSPLASAITIGVGASTAIGASLIAIAQVDIKRTLSYSVSAYMGLVFVAVGTSQEQAAWLLLLGHAMAAALLVMSIGTIVLSNITQDLRQLGGLWSRRPISGLSFLVGAFSLMALPPFGNFWALLALSDGLWGSAPWLVGLIAIVNGLTAFSLARTFGSVFGGKTTQMTVRAPEGLWPMVLPMTVMAGFVLHLPLLMQKFDLLPNWLNLNIGAVTLLTASSVVGFAAGLFVYLGNAIAKPVKLPWQWLQDFFAYDLYTEKTYRFTIVLAIGVVSKLIYWFDRYIIDGFVNLVGLATLLSGQTLRYNTSGQTQYYALSILLGVALLGILIAAPFLQGLPSALSFP